MLLTAFIGMAETCKMPGSNLKSLWMEFPPLIMTNISDGNSTEIKGALVKGVLSMIKTCCHSTVTKDPVPV